MIFVITGPESSGKSTLSQELAERLNWPMFPELARAYLQARQEEGGQSYRYRPSDLLILTAQQQMIEASLPREGHCILDTDLLTLLVWWQEKYGPVPSIIQQGWLAQMPRHYLLCKPDLPWEPDPLRENPHDRQRLWQWYKHELEQRHCSFSVCSGLGPTRLDSALTGIRQALV
jgi:nicotinamide riboside kinase